MIMKIVRYFINVGLGIGIGAIFFIIVWSIYLLAALPENTPSNDPKQYEITASFLTTVAVTVSVIILWAIRNSITEREILPFFHTPDNPKAVRDEVVDELQSLPTREEIEALFPAPTKRFHKFEREELKPIEFAIIPRSKINLFLGIVYEIALWIVFIPCGVILIIINHFDFTGTIKYVLLGSIRKVIQLHRESKRYRVNNPAKLVKAKNPPVLYLRSFIDDEAENSDRFDQRTFEEKLVRYYGIYGPVVAVGRPLESTPPLGAFRLYFNEGLWRPGVLYLMHISQLVIIHAGFTTGTLWEIGAARLVLPCEKVRISFHGWQGFTPRNKDRYYDMFRCLLKQITDLQLPADIGENKTMCFEDNWKPRLYLD